MAIFQYISLAITALKTFKVRTFLTTLGIVIGTTSVILLISLGTGLERYITKQIEDIGSNLLYVFPGSSQPGEAPGAFTVNRLTIKHVEYLRARLLQAEGVSGATRKIGVIKYKNKESKGAEILGIDVDFTKVVNYPLKEGRYLTQDEINSQRAVALIGTSAAKKISSSSVIGKQVIVSNKRYTVVGLLAEKGNVLGQDQDNTVMIPVEAMMRQFGTENINAIYIKAKSPEEVEPLKKRATDLLARRISTEDFSIQSQQQTLNTIQGILGVLSLALGGIAAISLLVGGIGIMNIMLVSVTERTKEIGLRKAVGAPPSAILIQFLIEAIVLSVFGGLIGIGLGYLGSFGLSLFISSYVPIWAVMLAFGFSVGVGVVFGVAPAIRASRLDPIVALRYE
jgi:ABC-type antimicrobial peptide transport system permease subunit